MNELTPLEQAINVFTTDLLAILFGLLILINSIVFIYLIKRIIWWIKKGRLEYEAKTKEKYFYPHKLEHFWGAKDNGFFYFVFAIDAILIIGVISWLIGKIFIC